MTTTLNDTTPAATPDAAPAAIRHRHSLARAGVAAQVVAGTYVVGMAGMALYLAPRGFTGAVSDLSSSLEFLLAHPAAMAAWYGVLYLLGGAAMAVVALGIGARLGGTPTSRVSVASGLAWATMLLASGSVALVGQHAVVQVHALDPDSAAGLWLAVSVVQDALGGGIEVVGALWLAAVGVAALRTRAPHPVLGGSALGLAAVGAVTVVPAAAEIATSVFGLGLIVWFTAVGLTLARRR